MPPAARVLDLHVCPILPVPLPPFGMPIIPPCAITVWTGGKPQARIFDKALCAPPDIIITGSPTVWVVGKPAARMFDITIHGKFIPGKIFTGWPTVWIGP